MNKEQFIPWIMGVLEYVDPKTLNEAQAKALLQGIKDHIALISTKVTPDRKIEEPESTEEKWKKLFGKEWKPREYYLPDTFPQFPSPVWIDPLAPRPGGPYWTDRIYC